MKALTLHQPWATCIAQHGKRVENRTWAPPPSIIGQRIAIHAGMKLNREVCLRLFDEIEDPADGAGPPAVPPVACKGAQGLWSLPTDIERAVREHEAAARARMVAEFVEAYS